MDRSRPALAFVLTSAITSLLGCATNAGAGGAAAPEATASERPLVVGEVDAVTADPAQVLERGLLALEDDEPARAVALISRYLAVEPDGGGARKAYPALARAHEQLGDFGAAIRAYSTYLERHDGAEDRSEMFARRGACEAETQQWERSARSYALARDAGGAAMLPSARIETLAREGYALFSIGEDERADALLREADQVFEAAEREESERFASYYFVGMSRFYRAAILHRRFRETPIRPSRAQMTTDFETKLALLQEAQDLYNHTISAKHVYWVSASGYQLGSLFEEFYDALMYAPVPSWLGRKQRSTYYEELKKQLRPVVNKAIWVFEKNLETARRLGYENAFTEQTQQRLSELQAILLASDSRLGEPYPRLAPAASRGFDPEDGNAVAEALPAADRKLFVPMPTSL